MTIFAFIMKSVWNKATKVFPRVFVSLCYNTPSAPLSNLANPKIHPIVYKELRVLMDASHRRLLL